MPCSCCGLSGHNARTCGNGKEANKNIKKSQGVNLYMNKAEYSTNNSPHVLPSTSNKIKSHDQNSGAKLKSVTKMDIQAKGKTTMIPKNTHDTDKAYEQAFALNNKLVTLSPTHKSHKSVIPSRQTFENKNVHFETKVNLDSSVNTTTPKVELNKDNKIKDSKKATVKVYCIGCNKYGHFEDTCYSKSKLNSGLERHCRVCNEKDHDRRTCPLLEDERAKAKLPGPTWMSEDAKKRLEKGPPEKDGPGHIYMYQLANPKTPEEAQIYKIGMSANLPERRIKVQESKNGEVYKVIMSEETPWHKLTEKVIHLHLKDVNQPRDKGDGKTEWFLGTREYFNRVIKDVIKEIKFCDYSIN